MTTANALIEQACDIALSQAQPSPMTILCVDDEPNILSSLRRLFRTQGHQVRTATSGATGLDIMANEPIDLVISDMRMPEMGGVEFLEQVRCRWPDAVRILLTGYADIESIMGAINRGEILRYIAKPWNDNDIVLIVKQALEHKHLEQEKRRLEALTQQKNEELAALNATLEQKVEERTEELKLSNQALQRTNDKLKTNFLTSIKMFSSLIELRGANLAGHSRRVADLARRLAVKAGVDARECQHVFFAGLLHSIGKIGFPDNLLDMPYSSMNGDHLAHYRKYPVKGEQLLIPLEELREAAKIVRSHQERFNGEGFPDGLSGAEIPLGARILALANDYDNLQIGAYVRQRLRADEAIKLMLSRANWYDPVLLATFQKMVTQTTDEVPSVDITALELRPGMVIAKDIVTRDGFLLLAADSVLSENVIRQILKFQESLDKALIISVHAERK